MNAPNPHGKTALITGGEGFTGGYLRAELERKGWQVFSGSQRGGGQNVTDLQIDLLDEESIANSISIAKPDVVFHMGAVSFVGHGDLQDIYQTNVIGTLNLARAIEKAADDCSRLIVASSASVYGSPTTMPVSEQSDVSPLSHYAVSKLAMEMALGVEDLRCDVLFVRPFNYTGRGQSTRFLVPKIVDAFRTRSSVLELGNVEIHRDFSDVRDVVSAYVSLAEASSKTLPRVVNICSGRAFSIADIISVAAKTTNHTLEVKTNDAFVRASDPEVIVGDNALLGRYQLNAFRPIEETIEWMCSS